MKFLEKDLEQIIFEATHEQLDDRGLWIEDGKMLRQLDLNKYGISDLVVFSKERYVNPFTGNCEGRYILINVIELKKDRICTNAFMQALRYVKGIKEYIAQRGCDISFHFRITLIGGSIDLDSSFVFLADLIGYDASYNKISDGCIDSVSLYTYKYSIDGIRFKEHRNYSITANKFNIKNKQK